MTDHCPTCGAPVRVVGGTTKHFEPVRVISDEEEWAATQRVLGAMVGRYGAALSEETEEQARNLVFVAFAGIRDQAP